MSHTEFRNEDGTTFLWKDCEIPGCPNQICLAKDEARYCYPHSSSGKTLEEIIADENQKSQNYKELIKLF